MIDAKELRGIIGANVRRMRTDKGWSQTTLAEKLGISYVHVNRVENGKYSPKAELLFTIADVLGCKTDDLRQACEKPQRPKGRKKSAAA